MKNPDSTSTQPVPAPRAREQPLDVLGKELGRASLKALADLEREAADLQATLKDRLACRRLILEAAAGFRRADRLKRLPDARPANRTKPEPPPPARVELPSRGT